MTTPEQYLVDKFQRYSERAAELWPSWSSAMRQRWAEARVYADLCPPRYGKLLPLFPIAHSNVYAFPRTLREANR